METIGDFCGNNGRAHFCHARWRRRRSSVSETGAALWRTFSQGTIRARVVEYGPGYLADHWCPRGHVLFVMEGSIISELEDGSKEELTAGMGYVAEDDEHNRHRSFSPNGAKLFIVD